MRKSFLCTVVIVVTMLACNDASQPERKDGFTPVLKTKEDTLYHAVMQGHDVGMAQMNKLKKYSVEVKKQLDSLAKLPNKGGALQQPLLTLQKELQEAQQGMDSWMSAFIPDSASGNETLRLQYLESEKVKVGVVKDKIFKSLSLADSVLVRSRP